MPTQTNRTTTQEREPSSTTTTETPTTVRFFQPPRPSPTLRRSLTINQLISLLTVQDPLDPSPERNLQPVHWQCSFRYEPQSGGPYLLVYTARSGHTRPPSLGGPKVRAYYIVHTHTHLQILECLAIQRPPRAVCIAVPLEGVTCDIYQVAGDRIAALGTRPQTSPATITTTSTPTPTT